MPRHSKDTVAVLGIERPMPAWLGRSLQGLASGPESKQRGSRLYRSSYAETESIKPDVDIAPEADGRADLLALVTPGAAADDAIAWLASPQPC